MAVFSPPIQQLVNWIIFIGLMSLFGTCWYHEYQVAHPPPPLLKKWRYPAEQALKRLSIQEYAYAKWNDSMRIAFGESVVTHLKKDFPQGYPIEDNDFLFSWKSQCRYLDLYGNLLQSDSALEREFNTIIK